MNKQKKRRLSSKKIFILCVVMCSSIFFMWNIFTPLVADDYSYSFVDCSMSKRVGSIPDILYSMWIHTFSTNGRLIPHAFVEFFIWQGKPLFNIVNTIIYMLFGLLVYKFINYNQKKYNVLIFLIVQAVFLFVFPVYGQTMLWLDGSCNYLWGCTFILIFLWLYYSYFYNPSLYAKKRWIVIAIISAFFAGGVSENSSAACVMGVLLFLFLYKIKNIKIPAWAIIGWIVNLLCWIGMILSPANFSRIDLCTESSSFIEKWMNRFQTCNNLMVNHLMILIIVAITLLTLEYMKHKFSDRFLISALFFLMSLAAHYSMIMVPTYPERAMTGSITFMLISVGIHVGQKEYEKTIINFANILMFFTFITLVTASTDILFYSKQYADREQEILQEKANGNLDVATYLIYPRSKYCSGYGLGDDLSEDSTYWKNAYMAAYYEINSISLKK